jgi:molybdopterin molybdotransferase
MRMISVEKAFERIVGPVKPLSTDRLPLAACSGRVLAGAIKARRSQPGCDVSAMDGYALKSSDLSATETTFKLVGESAAGAPFSGAIKSGETVRTFTGAAIPKGADQIVMQENTGPSKDGIFTDEAPNAGKHIRLMGYDFQNKQTVLEGGTYITAKSMGIAASAGHSHLMVYRAPTVAFLATGDELVSPDAKTFQPFETVNSTVPQLQAMVSDIGANTQDIGQAGDDLESLKAAIRSASQADILVTIGGASVGDKDYMQQALSDEGMKLDFWKVAMKPGKPLIFGRKGKQVILGLPGNPASAFVCALLFLRPLIDAMMGRPAPLPCGVPLPVATDLPANGLRQNYLRARLIGGPGERHVDAAVSQDSGQLSVLAQSDGLIVRPPNDGAIQAGTLVPFLPF